MSQVQTRMSEPYTHSFPLSDTHCIVYDGPGNCGIVSTSSLVPVLPVRYDEIESLSDSLMRIWNDSMCGIFSTKENAIIIPVEYNGVTLLNEDTDFRIETGFRCGIFSTRSTQRVILSPLWRQIKPLTESLILVTSNEFFHGIFSLATMRFAVKVVYKEIRMLSEKCFMLRDPYTEPIRDSLAGPNISYYRPTK